VESIVDLAKKKFLVIWEVEPPRRPNLNALIEISDAARDLTDVFLVPDCHLGKPSVSSLVIAQKFIEMNHPVIACLNARDRNEIAFKRDLLTAAVLGIDNLLFVHGDAPSQGSKCSDLTVHKMLEITKAIENIKEFGEDVSFTVGAAVKPGKNPAWKTHADFWFVQASSNLDKLFSWRQSVNFDKPVFVAVIVLASYNMASKLNQLIPDLDVPDSVLKALDNDSSFGIRYAAEQIEKIKQSGLFSGIHLIAGRKAKEFIPYLVTIVGSQV